MARPKKKELPAHTSFITLRITSDLYEVLTADAKAAHLSRSEYIRQLITDHHPVVHQEIVYTNPELLEKLRDLGKIGSNLNQIVRKYHALDIDPSPALEVCVKDIEYIKKLLEERRYDGSNINMGNIRPSG